MKHVFLTCIICTMATATSAAPRALSGEEINSLLPTIIVTGVGEDTRQTFSRSGHTDYVAGGRPSVGRWWVTATQYCSSWPPSSGRACYDVLLDETSDPVRLIWVDESGTQIENTITFKETSQ